jgi:hypothetical protein
MPMRMLYATTRTAAITPAASLLIVSSPGTTILIAAGSPSGGVAASEVARVTGHGLPLKRSASQLTFHRYTIRNPGPLAVEGCPGSKDLVLHTGQIRQGPAQPFTGSAAVVKEGFEIFHGTSVNCTSLSCNILQARVQPVEFARHLHSDRRTLLASWMIPAACPELCATSGAIAAVRDGVSSEVRRVGVLQTLHG